MSNDQSSEEHSETEDFGSFGKAEVISIPNLQSFGVYHLPTDKN